MTMLHGTFDESSDQSHYSTQSRTTASPAQSRQPSQFQSEGLLRYTGQPAAAPQQAPADPYALQNAMLSHQRNSTLVVSTGPSQNSGYNGLNPRTPSGRPVSVIDDNTIITIPGTNFTGRVGSMINAGYLYKAADGSYQPTKEMITDATAVLKSNPAPAPVAQPFQAAANAMAELGTVDHRVAMLTLHDEFPGEFQEALHNIRHRGDKTLLMALAKRKGW